MNVTYLDLKRQLDSIGGDVAQAVQRVLSSGVYILGDEVHRFESEWSSFCGSSGAVGVATGTDAIALALKATGAVREGRGDEVITAPLTAGYTGLGIQLAGGVPVFADIDPINYTLDPQSIEDSISPRTRAIMPVHLYGRLADMPSINSIAQKHGLLVIEDCAQAHGARADGKSAGSLADAAAFSFYPTKNLGAFGDGGIITAADTSVLDRARSLRQGGHQEALQSNETGLNSRLDEIQAAILREKMKYLESWNNRRRELAAIYSRGLQDIKGLQVPKAESTTAHVFHLYVVSHKERDRIREHLAKNGIETLIHYPFLLHKQPQFLRSGQAALPAAERVVNQILSLPLNPWLREEEVSYVIDVMRNFRW